MARTWRASRSGMRPPTRRSLQQETKELHDVPSSKPQHAHKKATEDENGEPESDEDCEQTKRYYDSLAKRWGVKNDEFDYEECRPRIWLHDIEQARKNHDGWSLSPWSLAYYDKYPEELDEEAHVRKYYARSIGKAGVECFIDTKQITLMVQRGDGHFHPVGLWNEVPEEGPDKASRNDEKAGNPSAAEPNLPVARRGQGDWPAGSGPVPGSGVSIVEPPEPPAQTSFAVATSTDDTYQRLNSWSASSNFFDIGNSYRSMAVACDRERLANKSLFSADPTARPQSPPYTTFSTLNRTSSLGYRNKVAYRDSGAHRPDSNSLPSELNVSFITLPPCEDTRCTNLLENESLALQLTKHSQNDVRSLSEGSSACLDEWPEPSGMDMDLDENLDFTR